MEKSKIQIKERQSQILIVPHNNRKKKLSTNLLKIVNHSTNAIELTLYCNQHECHHNENEKKKKLNEKKNTNRIASHCIELKWIQEWKGGKNKNKNCLQLRQIWLKYTIKCIQINREKQHSYIHTNTCPYISLYRSIYVWASKQTDLDFQKWNQKWRKTSSKYGQFL